MDLSRLIIPDHVLTKSIPNRCPELNNYLKKLPEEEQKEFIKKMMLNARDLKYEELCLGLKKRKADAEKQRNLEVYFRSDETYIYFIKQGRYEEGKPKLRTIKFAVWLASIYRKDSFEGNFKVSIKEYLEQKG